MDTATQSSSEASQIEQHIDIKKILLTLLKYKWRIIFFSMMVTAIAVLVALSRPSLYTSTATLLIESKQAKAVSVEEVYGLEIGRAHV